MDRAKLLLYDTNLSITKIAEILGYSSTEYFVRVFRCETDVTPRTYRQAFRADEES